MECEKCGTEESGDSLISFCSICEPREEILRRALWSLTHSLSQMMDESRGVLLNPDVDAGMLADKGALLRWADAIQSCWLGAYMTAIEALTVCGEPKGYPSSWLLSQKAKITTPDIA